MANSVKGKRDITVEGNLWEWAKHEQNCRDQGGLALNNWISEGETFLPSIPPSGSFRRYILSHLGLAKVLRYLGPQRWIRDLDDIILYFTEVILLPIRNEGPEEICNPVDIFYHLTCALYQRFIHANRLSDLSSAVQYLRYLLSSSLISYQSEAPLVLAEALFHQSQLGQANPSEGIADILTLYEGCLSSYPPSGYAVSILDLASQAIVEEYVATGLPYHATRAVRHLERARKTCQSEQYAGLTGSLALVLYVSLSESGSGSQQQTIASLFQEGLSLLHPHDLRHVLMRQVAENDPLFRQSGVDRHLEPRSARESRNHPPQRPHHPSLHPSTHVGHRDTTRAGSAAVPSHDTASPLSGWKTVSLRPADRLARGPAGTNLNPTNAEREVAACLQRFQYTRDVADVCSAYRLAYQARLWDRKTLSNAASLFLRVYKTSGAVGDLQMAVELSRGGLEVSVDPVHRFLLLGTFAKSLAMVYAWDGDKEHLEDSMSTFQVVTFEGGWHATALERFHIATDWAHMARTLDHSSAPQAYSAAFSLLQNTIVPGPSFADNYVHIVDAFMISLPLDYASYQIKEGLFEEAIETLEAGRSLLWSELRKLYTINRDLEEFASSTSWLTSVDPGDPTVGDASHGQPEAFTLKLEEHQRLVGEHGQVIRQIRELPGFEGFMRTTPFTTLQKAASGGPIIIVNHSSWRTNVLIVLHDALPVFVPLGIDDGVEFFDRISALADEMRPKEHEGAGSYSKEYDRQLRKILQELYKLVGEPIVDKLRELGIPEQSRVWWCPTSVFCSLPLHAMGPVPSSDGRVCYFSDLYVCSYTTTLDALIASRTVPSNTPNPPSLLSYGQKRGSSPAIDRVMDTVRSSGVRIDTLISERTTKATLLNGLRTHSLVHVSCHGLLPFAHLKSSGALREPPCDNRILLGAVLSRESRAEFAFLSTCHTAELPDVHGKNEALHLAAAMQYCSGFKSIVGTMWVCANDDGNDMAEEFYKRLFSPVGKARNLQIGERAARALRDATQALRMKEEVTLERWVNFVHFGA
ncbi:CHAT domain-containing protein [Gloeopeniophorella convolvens]|nr:CHAT domain-containing protein [Gloeopeniophorella convolvens]